MKPLLIALSALHVAAGATLAATVKAPATVAVTDRGVLVAHDEAIELFDLRGTNTLWRTEGVQAPSKIVASGNRAAVLDPMANEVKIVDLTTGRGATFHTGETPIDALFAGGDLFLLERDARRLERIGAGGVRESVPLASDPAFLREAGGKIFVYSRVAGALQEIVLEPFAVRRTMSVSPFASDFEVDGRNAYLVDPQRGKVDIVALSTMKPAGSVAAGAVPVDLTLLSGPTPLTARTFAVADPSARRVWMIEGAQSFTQAFARGFVRGLLGLGLFGRNSSQFPSGLDRLFVSGRRWYAYDSSSGTLYRFTKSKSSVVARSLPPQAFAIGEAGVYVWDDEVRRLQQLDGND